MADHLSPPWSHVCHVLQSLEQRRADCVVTVDDDSGATLTGSQLVADVACLARGLETFCGVAPGERVCIAALNSSAYVQWLLAVPAVGAILAPLNHRWVSVVSLPLTVTPSHCHSLSLSLPLTVTPSHCHSLSLSLPLTVTPSHCHSLSLSLPLTVTPSHCHSLSLSLPLSVTPSHCHSLSLSLPLSVTPSHCHSLSLSLPLSVTPSHCHSLSVSLPLTVTPSHCHSLSVSLPLSVTPSQCHSLSVSLPLSVTPSQCHSLSVSLPLTVTPSHCHSLSVSLPLTVTPSHCHSLSLSLPLTVTPSQCHSLSLSLPLTVTPSQCHSLSLSLPLSVTPSQCHSLSVSLPLKHGRGSSGGAAGGADCPGGGCTHAALSIGEAAAAVQQVRATVLVVDAHMLPWWAHLKPLCPSLRLGVLISEGPTATTPSSASSSSALSHTALILQSLAKLACAGYRHDDVSHVTLLKCRAHNTGTPKAAALSHTALISQSLAKLARAAYRHDDAAALSHTALISQSLAKLACAGYCHDDAFLHVAPLCHIGGISSLLAMLTACARNVLVPRFLPSHLPRLLSRHRITALIAVPAMLTDLLNACSGEKTFIAVPAMLTDLLSACSSKQREPSTSFPLVRTLLVGGVALSPSLQRHTEALFPCARLMLAYGMTEAASSITFAMLRDPAGAETAGAQASARPEGQAQAAPFDSTAVPSQPSAHKSCPVVGEVLTRGPHVMSGYWGRPDETAAVLSPEGWLRTGDMGWIDFSGQLWLLGRRKEMMKSGGENVFCAEVEEAVRAHPGVAAAAAAGVPDERMGEAVAVLLVLKPGWVWSGVGSNDSGGGDAGGAGGASDVGRFGSGGGSAARAAAAKNVSLSDLHAACQQHGLSRYFVSLNRLSASRFCSRPLRVASGEFRFGISPRQHNQRQQEQQRRLVGVFTVRSSAVENAAAETNVTDEGKQLQQRKAEWARVRGVAERGAVVRGRVVSANAGGLMVRLGPLQAFLPLSQLDPSRLRGTASPAPSVADVTRGLVGSMVGVRVLELDEARTRLVVSEKRAAAGKGLPRVQQGRVYPGVVSSLTDFGAFVDLFQPEGVREEGDKEGGKGGEKEGDKEGAFLATGLVHVSELSWDPVRSPADVVAVGDTVNALVLQVDRERGRVGLSLKQVQADPLLETLDRLLPFQPAPDATSPSASALEASSAAPSSPLPGATSPPALPGLLALCNQLRQQPGIVSVTLGRQAVERRVVSQDLELWLSNAPAAEGQFALLARAGRLVSFLSSASLPCFNVEIQCKLCKFECYAVRSES
ncbi:unnamed protein product [Closterium sp. NIES-64]|nr:unnamed protein product [Closterium sp. NIES-64]